MRCALFRLCLALAVGVLCGAAAPGEKAGGEAIDRDFPPHVIKTEPAICEKNVDFNLKEIKVTFDRPMQTDKAWSWIIHENLGVYPGYKGGPEPRWEDDGRTCVLAVKLSPDTVYAVGVNSVRHSGFRDADGKVAAPYVWVFKTRK